MNTLVLHYSIEQHEGVERIGLVPILRLNDGRLFFRKAQPRLCALAQALEVADALFARVRSAVEAMGPEVDLRSAAGFYGDLQRLGCQLLELLVPAEILDLLRNGARLSHLIFSFDPRLNGIPFDWMWLDGDFLGFRFAVGRELLSSDPAALQRLKGRAGLPFTGRFLLVPPPGLNDAQRSEVLGQAMDFFARWTQLGRLGTIRFDTLNLDGKFSVQEALEAFQTREIVNVYSHYSYCEAEPAQSGYALSTRCTVTAQQLLEGFAAGQAPPLLVFSLCCESAITRGWEQDWPEGGRVFGIVDAAKRIGVAHYIGTLVEVPALKTIGLFPNVLRRAGRRPHHRRGPAPGAGLIAPGRSGRGRRRHGSGAGPDALWRSLCGAGVRQRSEGGGSPCAGLRGHCRRCALRQDRLAARPRLRVAPVRRPLLAGGVFGRTHIGPGHAAQAVRQVPEQTLPAMRRLGDGPVLGALLLREARDRRRPQEDLP